MTFCALSNKDISIHIYLNVNQMAALAQNKSLVMKHWTGTGGSAGKSASALANNNIAVFYQSLFKNV
jgi:hypothetical protein